MKADGKLDMDGELLYMMMVVICSSVVYSLIIVPGEVCHQTVTKFKINDGSRYNRISANYLPSNPTFLS